MEPVLMSSTASLAQLEQADGLECQHCRLAHLGMEAHQSCSNSWITFQAG